MKNKKKYLFLLIVLLSYFAVIFVIFGLDNLKSKLDNIHIILSPNIKWSLSKGKWENIDGQVNLYNLQKYELYVNHKYLGNYKTLYNEKWRFLDDDNHSVNYVGNVFGYRGNRKVEMIDFQYQQISSDLILSQVLEREKLSAFDDYIIKRRIEIDLDNDQKDEYIYEVGNVFNFETSDHYSYSLLFVIDDKEIDMLRKEVASSEEMLDICSSHIKDIIDINNDGNYELITSCIHYDLIPDCYQLYQMDNKGKYTSLIETCSD